MAYSQELKLKVRKLRNQGYAIREIARIFKLSPDTVIHWIQGIELNDRALKRLAEKRKIAQTNGIKTIELHRQQLKDHINKTSHELVTNIKIDTNLARFLCSLIFWCEGSKNYTSVKFTNSDPTLIKIFLDLLRKGFEIDERKLRGLVHVHAYHDEPKQKIFWSSITGIPLNQFNKSYLKPNTGINKHKDYQGCIAINYYDAKVAKELAAIYNSLTKRGVG